MPCRPEPGAFSTPVCARDELVLRWDSGDGYAQLHVELAGRRATVEVAGTAGARRYVIAGGRLEEAAGSGAGLEQNA